MSWETDADAAVESIRQNLGGWITPAYEAEIRASFVPSAAPAAASISPTVAPVTAPATLTAPDVSSDDDNSDDTSDSAPVFIPAPLPPPNNPPSLSLNAPAFVIAGQSFAVSISASDPNSDLNSMGIREQGSGLIGHWDISGGSSSASVAVTAPASGPLQFRGEVWDNAGNSAVGGWQIVQVTPAPKIQPPANDPPSVSVQAPASVTAGQSFAVSISASDPNADLNSMGIREQGIGLIGHWDISGGSSSASVAVTAPASGPLQFRGEVWDNAGNSSAGPWQSVLVTVPALVVSLPVDNATPAAQSPIMPAGVAPSVSINAPSEVFPGDTFEVLAIASDPDGDLASMGIRWQGHGLIGSWDLTGVHATSSGRTAQITVPATGPILVRAEVHDLAGNGFTSDWVTINVASQPAPSAAGIDSWVRIDSVPTSTPGVSRLQLTALPGAPAAVSVAIAEASQAATSLFGIGSATADQLLGLIRTNYLRDAATAVQNGVLVSSIPEGPGAQIYSAPVSSDPPTVSLTIPASVTVGQQFTASAAAADPNSDLSSMVIRQDGLGVVQSWTDLSGAAQTRSAQLNAPMTTGAIRLRAEVTDAAGHTTSGDWRNLTVLPAVVVSASPTIALSLPQSVLPRQGFTVTITAADPNGDLNSMGIREQGGGLLGHWDISGNSQTRSVQVTAPDANATLQFRGEVWDNAGNGVTGDWQAVTVATNAAFDPTHRLAGWDANGHEVYHLTDEAGNTIEWAVLPGHDSREIIDGTLRTLSGPSPQPSQVVSLTPPVNHPNQDSSSSDQTTTAKSGIGGAILLGLGVAVLVVASSRKHSS